MNNEEFINLAKGSTIIMDKKSYLKYLDYFFKSEDYKKIKDLNSDKSAYFIPVTFNGINIQYE